MKSSKVEDPKLIAALNEKSTKVTDPALLSQLNSENEDGDENLLKKIIRYGIQDPAIGILNMGRNFANLPHRLSAGYIPELSPSDYDFSGALGVEKPNSGDKLSQFAGQYLPALLLGRMPLGIAGEAIGSIPKIGPLASRVLSEAIPQGIYAATQAPESPLKSGAETAGTQIPFSLLSELMSTTNPIARIVAKGASGLGSAYLGKKSAETAGAGETISDLAGILGGALGVRGFSTKKEMMKKLTEGVNPELAEQRLKMANQLGLDYLTPAEAGISPWAAKQQGSLGRTEEGGKMMYERGIKRQESEKNAINNVLDSIYNESEMGPKIKEAYENMQSVNLPEEFSTQYNNNEIINHAKSKIENEPAYKESLKGIPKTSLVYWDHVKRALDDMINTAERSGNKNEARILSNTRKDMRDQMDNYYPEYKEARGLYERKTVREGLEKVFDRKEINGTNFYQALASQNKFDELLGHLRNAPEAAENLKAMRSLFKDLMGPPTIKTAKGTEERGMNQSRSTGAYLENLLEHVFTKGVNDTAAIEFITSKDWANKLKEINKISDKQMKLAALSLALSKGISQYAGSS